MFGFVFQFRISILVKVEQSIFTKTTDFAVIRLFSRSFSEPEDMYLH